MKRKSTLPPVERFSGANRFLSNFFACNITVEGVTYRSVEHAYQAAKTPHHAEKEWIREAETPGLAKRRGQEVRIRKGWDTQRDQVMLGLLRRKFFSDDMLGALLLDTGDAELIEGNYWGDVYWGRCDGAGQNRLGELLMKVRDELRKRRG